MKVLDFYTRGVCLLMDEYDAYRRRLHELLEDRQEYMLNWPGTEEMMDLNAEVSRLEQRIKNYELRRMRNGCKEENGY